LPVQAARTHAGFEVTADGTGVVGHVGAALLAELADRLGLTAALGWRADRSRTRRHRHQAGRVLRDLAVLLADGGDCLSDLAALRDQPELFGEVASTATAWRVVEQVAGDELGLAGIRAARAHARGRAWTAGAHPDADLLVVDVDGTLLDAHSDKQGAAGTYKHGYGFYPLVPHHRQVIELLRTPDEFDLLHFAGHGRATSEDITDAQILLQGRMQKVLRSKQLVEVYRQEPLRAVSVRQNFLVPVDDETMTRPIVVLNACQSGRLGYQLSSIGGFAEAFVGGGAGAFVGSLWSVGDSPASTFIQTLYEELLAGQTVAGAVRTAREHARDSGDATWLAYTVYAHPEAHLRRT
jgi:hypothetical protein